MKRGIIALISLVLFVACGNANSTKSSNTQEVSSESKSSESNQVEVLYMHGKQRCPTCIAIGTEAEAVVAEFEGSGVVFKTVDFSTAQGEKIADSYEIASSSLLVVRGDKVENLTAQGFQYARVKPELFRKSLKETIQKLAE